MNEIGDLYNSSSDIELYNKIFDNLKTFFIEYTKAKFPVAAAIAALKKEKLMEIEEERLNKLLKDINNKIKCIDKSKVDYNFIKTEEFARITFNVFDKARVDYREEKLKYYANILVHYSTIDFSKDFYKERILEKISMYTAEHIIVLDKAYEFIKTENPIEGIDLMAKGEFYWKHIKQTTNLPADIINLCIIDLQTDGLLHELTGARFNYNGGMYSITEYGIKCMELIKEHEIK